MANENEDNSYEPVLVNNPEKINALGAQLDEMMRASERRVGSFVEPIGGSLAKLKAERHHFVFGRRGSGKSSLMFKARAELLQLNRAVAFVDLQNQTSHSLPNLLLKTIELILSDVGPQLRARGAHPQLLAHVDELRAAAERAQLVPDVARKTVTQSEKNSSERRGNAATRFSLPLAIGVSGGVSGASEESSGTQTVSEFDEHKIVLVGKLLDDFRNLVAEISSAFQGLFIFLDDAYYISPLDQPSYFHHLQAVCGRNAWLKIGAVKHRAIPYASDDAGPRGLQLGHDASEIDLDSSLEDYATTEDFLHRLLDTALRPCEIRRKDLIGDNALRRMVQASGGVARDFLTILAESVARARERILQLHAAVRRGEKSEGELRANQRISAPDIWNAASRLNDNKKAALRKDIGSNDKLVLPLLTRMMEFVTSGERVNSILLQNPDSFWQDASFLKLFEFKMVHIVHRQRRLRGEDYVVLMLDVGELAHNQSFWQLAVDLLNEDHVKRAERASQRFQPALAKVGGTKK